MKVFNSFYYSFSPQIAEYERGNTLFKNMVKYSILPLLGILQISEFSYQISSNSELAVIFSGFITAMLIGIVYCSPFALIIQKVRNGKSFSRKFLIILLTSFIVIMIGMLINTPIILMFTTSFFILSIIVGFSFLIPAIIISCYKKLNISLF